MRDNIDNSSVFKDFVKLAHSYGWVKEADDNDVIRDKYNVTDETGKELIDRAHPDEVWAAEALGDGGLVENQNEQHDTMISILYKMPEGSLLGRHAKLVDSLTKTADRALISGNRNSYVKINNSIEAINDKFYKEASPAVLWPAVAGIATFIGRGLLSFISKETVKGLVPSMLGKALIAGGISAGAMGMASKVTSRQEKLSIDIKDAIEDCDEILESKGIVDQVSSVFKKSETSEVHSQVEAIKNHLSKFSDSFAGPIPTDPSKLEGFVSELVKLSLLFKSGGPIATLEKELSESWYKFGLGEKSRLKEKLNDVRAGIKKMGQSLGALEKIGKIKMPKTQKEDKGLDVKSLLERAGYSTKHGVAVALKSVEEEVSRRHGRLLQAQGGSIRGKLVNPQGATISAVQLAKLLKAVGKI